MTRQALVIDTNLLVLYVVGTASQAYISRHKKLTAFTPKDYEALIGLLALVEIVEVTPHILTETSNLATYTAEPARGEILSVLRQFIDIAQEVYTPGKQAAAHPDFHRLGLPDVAVISSIGPGCTLLTTDLDLYVAAVTAGIDAINFNHLRDQYL